VATDNFHEESFKIGSGAVRMKSVTYRKAQVLRLSKGSGELLAWKYPAEVLQRPGGPGHGDPMATGAIGQREGDRPMQTESTATPATGVTWNSDLDHPGHRRNPPQRPGTSMAEDGTLSTRQDCGHPSAFIADTRLPYRIDTAIGTVQAAGGDTVTDRTRAQPGTLQLPR
jgi:hypothetical protein